MTFLSRKTLLAATITVAAIGTGFGALASSHREAPHITKYPQEDGTDFYMFNSYEDGREDFVTILANYNPIQAGFAGPNYFLLDNAALYEIHIDNDGDAVEDITFQIQMQNAVPDAGVVEFTIGQGSDQKNIPSVLRNVAGIAIGQADGLSFEEKYTAAVVRGGRLEDPELFTDANANTVFEKPFDNAGTKTFSVQNYTDFADSFIQQVNIPGCDQQGRVFVGQRLEGFKLAIGEIFDLINFVPIEGDSAPGAGDGQGFPGGITQDVNRNQLATNNVTTIALEVPKSCLVGEGNGVIGGWTTASVPQITLFDDNPSLEEPEDNVGGFVQVSRLGNPLVNELVIGITDKDKFNASFPEDDGQFADFVTHPVLAAIIDILFRDAVNDTLNANIPNLAPSNIPRQDLVTTFLTGFEGVNQLQQVTASDMLRLNTTIDAVPREEQDSLGVLNGDLAGFPNGRRPGDDVVDIALRVVMGALCHDLPLGVADDSAEDDEGDEIVLNLAKTGADGNAFDASGAITNRSKRARGFRGGRGKADEDVVNEDDIVEDGAEASVNLGLCEPADAPVGDQQLTDGAPVSAMDFDNTFPYLITPFPGSPIGAAIPTPKN
ncbi:MAG: DUF4331 domain-containing protein [Exilibacterium sp.]